MPITLRWSGEAQQAASGGCIAASPRRVLAQHCAKRETKNVNVRMSARYALGIFAIKDIRHMYADLERHVLSLLVSNDPDHAR